MQEKLDDEFVHSRAFGERQGFAHQTPEALAQGVVEALDGVGRTFGIRGLVLSGGQDIVIGVHRVLMVSGWDPGPKQLSRGVIARAQGVGYDLAGTSTEGQPQLDDSTPPPSNKGPQFIQFQRFIGNGRHPSLLLGRHTQGFFQTGDHRVARHVKGPAQPAQAAAFCISAQNSVPLSR